MLQSFPNLFLYMVDTYQDEGLPKALSSKMTASQAKAEAERAVEPFKDRIEWLIMPSVEAAERLKDGALDYVFIDACHNYEPVKADIEAWYPKVRSGGIVAGHDFSVHFEGVKQSVRERFGEDGFSVARGKVWWMRKPERGGTFSASLL